mmetsp:Transcript_29223/g.45766  ORF Transcript_29223/g.45766 Transcript_29223/m.45766 type:complete len:226 (+) Transcript_29223:1102-1779(+)
MTTASSVTQMVTVSDFVGMDSKNVPRARSRLDTARSSPIDCTTGPEMWKVMPMGMEPMWQVRLPAVRRHQLLQRCNRIRGLRQARNWPWTTFHPRAGGSPCLATSMKTCGSFRTTLGRGFTATAGVTPPPNTLSMPFTLISFHGTILISLLSSLPVMTGLRPSRRVPRPQRRMCSVWELLRTTLQHIRRAPQGICDSTRLRSLLELGLRLYQQMGLALVHPWTIL